MVTTKLEATRRLVRGSSASSSAARRAACRRFRVGSAGGCGVSGRPRPVAVRSSKVFEWENDTGEGTASDPSEVLSGLADKVKTEAPFLGLLTKLISPQGVSRWHPDGEACEEAGRPTRISRQRRTCTVILV